MVSLSHSQKKITKIAIYKSHCTNIWAQSDSVQMIVFATKNAYIYLYVNIHVYKKIKFT